MKKSTCLSERDILYSFMLVLLTKIRTNQPKKDCPNCFKKLELKGEGDKKTFVCKCGHRENINAFNKRKAEDKNKASKKDVANYIKNQQKTQDSFNTSMFDALNKLKK